MWKLLNEFQSKGHHTCQKLSAYGGKHATGMGELSWSETGRIRVWEPRQSFPRETGVSTPSPTLIGDLSGKARCDLSAQDAGAQQQPKPSTQLFKYVFNTQSRRNNSRIPRWWGIELHLSLGTGSCANIRSFWRKFPPQNQPKSTIVTLKVTTAPSQIYRNLCHPMCF